MSKNISSTDLLLIPELSHLRMLDIIDPKNDSLVATYLKIIGFDLDYPVNYVPCQHRNMQGKVVVAYMVTGEVCCNHSFLSSQWASIEDRIIAAGYRDISLAEAMADSMTICRDSTNDGALEGFPQDMANPDEKKILAEIKLLDELLFIARGSPFKLDGSRKTLAEYGLVEAPEKARKKATKLVK